ncbi:MAG: hypothetical protein VW146_05650 [Gammaproteobacteria bacterium]
MFFYPGGTLHDHFTQGYIFTQNFISELGLYKTRLGGEKYISLHLFILAMSGYGLMAVAFTFVPRLFSTSKKAYRMAYLGSIFFVIGSLFFVGVAFTPADLYFDAHVFFAVNGFRIILPGAFCYLLAFKYMNLPRNYFFIGLAYLLGTLAYVIFQIFAADPRSTAEAMVAQVVAQKLIALLSVATIFSFSYAFERLYKELIG